MILQFRQVRQRPAQMKHVPCVVPPRFLIEAVVEVLVHVILVVIQPRLWIVIELIMVDFWDLQLFPSY